jgi:hypothetical protein
MSSHLNHRILLLNLFALFLFGCGLVTTPNDESTSIAGQYIVITRNGETVEPFAEQSNFEGLGDRPYIIEINSSQSDEILSGQVLFGRWGWLQIRDASNDGSSFYLDIIDPTGFYTVVFFTELMFGYETLAGAYYLGGPLIDPRRTTFTAVIE